MVVVWWLCDGTKGFLPDRDVGLVLEADLRPGPLELRGVEPGGDTSHSARGPGGQKQGVTGGFSVGYTGS